MTQKVESLFFHSTQIVAESLQVNLTLDGANSLAVFAEQDLRALVQDAAIFMRRSKRTTLHPEDINAALLARNQQPVFGFEHSDPPQFKTVIGLPDSSIDNEEIIDLDTIIDAPLPPQPYPPAFVAHWLSVNGVQPLIPQNPVPPDLKEDLLLNPSGTEGNGDPLQEGWLVKSDIFNLQVSGELENEKERIYEIKPPVKHDISTELQLYFSKVAETILRANDEVFKPRTNVGGENRKALFETFSQETDAVFHSVSTSLGLQRLVPYFAQFIAQETVRHMTSIPILLSLMKLVSSMFDSPHLDLVPYCHVLIPPILTCTVSNKLGTAEHRQNTGGAGVKEFTRPITNQPRGVKGTQHPSSEQHTSNTRSPLSFVTHLDLRRVSAVLLSTICIKFSPTLPTFQSRLVMTYISCVMDPTRSLASHLGCVIGIVALGPHAFHSAFLPHIPSYLTWIRPLLSSDDADQREEAEGVVKTICEGLVKLCHHPDFVPIFPVQNVGGEMIILPASSFIPNDTPGQTSFVVPLLEIRDAIGSRGMEYFPIEEMNHLSTSLPSDKT
ncbi:putative Transcription initiation factor TFIID subunit 6 [Blattamonas nauphoetae]|uniref:Transcription initiation factor TFIID subunit 6 n=1 Tax=Blattamonas nauphoetae TaxID=2049346 RepID=A0ABQ9XD29_9EUKA|nr:putative Transcription initiation factor TFIID subunit 6 [Blattamonas nauphoetae]